MRRGAFLSAFVIAACLAFAGVAGAAAPPGNFKRHENRYWTWYAPKGWIASYGANDIYITSPTGTDYLHYGAGGLICPNTAQQFFGQARTGLKNYHSASPPGLYSRGLKSARYTRVGKITRPFGINRDYFRQAAAFIAKTRGNRQIKGEIVLDVFVVDLFSGVCGERIQIRSAPSEGFGQSLKLLRTVQSVIFGPRQ